MGWEGRAVGHLSRWEPNHLQSVLERDGVPLMSLSTAVFSETSNTKRLILHFTKMNQPKRK